MKEQELKKLIEQAEADYQQHYDIDGVSLFNGRFIASSSADFDKIQCAEVMNYKKYRTEVDSLGKVQVPKHVLYGIQTQRAINNFIFSDLRMPNEFICALAKVKKIAAKVNVELGLLNSNIGDAIAWAAQQIIDGQYRDQFPLDVFQTGSGTSTHLNMNEVLANLAQQKISCKVSASDHVNLGQSSNDVIPTAMHLSAALECHRVLLPNLNLLHTNLKDKAKVLDRVVKIGRTHLMDALPLLMSQEVNAWANQIQKNIMRIHSTLPRVYKIALGGTAVGTGQNAHPEFAHRFAKALSKETGFPFIPNDSLFESISAQDTIVELSGQLKVIAVSLMKISNDLRWMNSGPYAGLGEIELKPLQEGSSFMPGKVNPVIPEAVTMIAAQVIGNDTTVTIAGQSGNFQLNVMLPVMAYNILQSIKLLGNACLALAEKCILDFKVNEENLSNSLENNPIMATLLSPIIGYTKATQIANIAYSQKKSILDVALDMTSLKRDELEKLLNPHSIISFKDFSQ